MYAQIVKPKENKSRAVANSIIQKKRSERQSLGIVDNRLEAVTQRKLQTDLANDGPKTMQLKVIQNHASKGPQMKQPTQSVGSVIQRVLIDNGFAAWIDEDIPEGPEQLNAVREAIAAYNIEPNDELSDAANVELNNLAALLSGPEMTQNVFNNLGATIPDLQQGHIALVATYNFNGPITLSLENVMAWLRIANNNFTIDDVRYVRHELVEIRSLQDIEAPVSHLQGPEVVPEDEGAYEAFFEGENGFNANYMQAHGAAIAEEVEFLTRAVNHANPALNANQDQVAHSHPTRTEEFLANFPTQVQQDQLFNEENEIQLNQLENYDENVHDALMELTMENFNVEADADVFRIENLPHI